MKRTAIIVLLCSLFFVNIANAKFSDEYKTKYPRRVKVETRLDSRGRTTTRTTYNLFKRNIDGTPFKLVFIDCGGIIKFCDLVYGSCTNHPAKFIGFTWGDGQKRHDIGKAFTYTDRRSHHSFFNFISSGVTAPELSDMKNAVVISVQGGGCISRNLIDQSDKHWKKWQEAVDAAEKLMSERWRP